MTMKNNSSGVINYWKLFLLRYLLLGNGAVDLELCQKEAIELLKHFLDYVQELNLKQINAGVTEQKADYLRRAHKKDAGNYVKRAVDKKLSVKDLHLLFENYSSVPQRDSYIESAWDIIHNLIITFDFKQSESKIKNLLDAHIQSILRNKLKTHIRISLSTNFYSYYYQKNHFIKSIPRYFEECASDEVNLLERRDGKLFGEENHRTTFLETLLSLEREGALTITRMGIAESEPYEVPGFLLSDKKMQVTDPLVVVTIRIDDLYKHPATLSKMDHEVTPQLPKGWDLKINEQRPQITNFNQVVFTFPNNWSNKYRYFVCLWKNYGQRVDYKTIYEFESGGQIYPGREKPWKVNRRIRDTITKLKDKLAKLPINIEISKGFTLTIN
ncbi:hypothetical protein COX24_03605 [bacterium (Candidatus Gribaldobacteria) CG23_combo_of_CG06-09_8_20_14_all_37_87_8]|uniref:Uncharacterized protein n=1 Tax=bacterium (Candidatus Gribaldobacteria) CG23_combo_of_CG06-09_8_20_14_all_37_87_8 TaxID=2014278 RepID=A0A2G9ZFT7_9BACT|nr:MAG: hypothetical protein COX24_03605 [bacterium (Candidatus Gribaldobacteria) CG23_combo_of_CG06-09_8_20_14_all_37_87_8]